MKNSIVVRERFKDLLAQVQKPARYIGNEWNSIAKDQDLVEVTVALAFPDLYELGMSHLGTQILYHEINKRPDAAAERVFAPWIDMEALLRAEGLPLLSLETWKAVRGFDLVGFTLQYELSYSNILNMLDLALIPLRAQDRGPGDPLVMAGGPCAYNAEPLAEFLDFLVLGDGEEVIHEVLEAFRDWKRLGKPGGRDAFLKELVQLRGIYVPSFYQVDYLEDGRVRSIKAIGPGIPETVTRRVLEDLDQVEYPTAPVVPHIDVVHDRAVVELFRGCTRGCRFCHAGTVYRPVRERSPERVKDLARRIMRETGYGELGLVSLSTSDYGGIEEVTRDLAEWCEPLRASISLPSLRVDSFSVGLADRAQRVRKTGLTLAPEAGSQRLRDFINKGVTHGDFLEAMGSAVEAGWENIKLYFMIGLPTEDEEDVLAIAALARDGLEVFRRKKAAGLVPRGQKPLRLTLSVGAFVPKAHTPFQWEAQLPITELKRRIELLRSSVRGPRLALDWHAPEMSFLEAVFSRGDRRLGEVLYRAWKRGCKFDGWSEHFRYREWLQVFDEVGLAPEFYANREREVDEVFPWDHLDTGVRKEFLLEERNLAYEGVTTPDCRYDHCTVCGICMDLGVDLLLKG